MNKEIEKILEIKEDCDYKKLSIEEMLLLKEYITNLQEDLKYQKEMYDEYCDKHTKLMQEYSNLKKENARLKALEEKINFEELLKHKGEYYLSMVESQRLRK